MRRSYPYAWGKLYQAVLEMATGIGDLPTRVTHAYRNHISSLNSQNLPPHSFARLKEIRANVARRFDNEDEEDATINLSPLTSQQAARLSEEIISLYDEIASSSAVELHE